MLSNGKESQPNVVVLG